MKVRLGNNRIYESREIIEASWSEDNLELIIWFKVEPARDHVRKAVRVSRAEAMAFIDALETA